MTDPERDAFDVRPTGEQMLARVQADAPGSRGRLRVYCHQGLTRFIALVVTGLLENYPEMSLDLRSGDAMIDLVQEGFDLAIRFFLAPHREVHQRPVEHHADVVVSDAGDDARSAQLTTAGRSGSACAR